MRGDKSAAPATRDEINKTGSAELCSMDDTHHDQLDTHPEKLGSFCHGVSPPENWLRFFKRRIRLTIDHRSRPTNYELGSFFQIHKPLVTHTPNPASS
jgi:hypothetical protein